MSKWYTFDEVLPILKEKRMDDKDFLKLSERLCNFNKPGNTTKKDFFMWAGAEMFESKYIMTCFYDLFTSENVLLRHGVRMVTGIILSFLENGEADM